MYFDHINQYWPNRTLDRIVKIIVKQYRVNNNEESVAQLYQLYNSLILNLSVSHQNLRQKHGRSSRNEFLRRSTSDQNFRRLSMVQEFSSLRNGDKFHGHLFQVCKCPPGLLLDI